MKVTKFESTFDSLRTFECPRWFRDAKFGIWSSWGPQSVPMYGDWYARSMYLEGSQTYLYHLRHYGHPSKFGYKDIVKLWKAEKFDPDALMDKYVKAGAHYFAAQAVHHDNFFNYPSKINRFNSVNMGPMKDICGLWKRAADNLHLPFGITEHLDRSFEWWKTNKGADTYGPYKGIPYDGNDPEYRDYYFDNSGPMDPLYGPNAGGGHKHDGKSTTPDPLQMERRKKFWDYWLAAVKEMIDLYTPDLLYTDGGLPFGVLYHVPEELVSRDTNPCYHWGLEAVSYLYNNSIEKYGENHALYNHKDDRPEFAAIGVLDKERTLLPDIAARPWQTENCIGNWFYDVRAVYKRPGLIIDILIDIISKNGCLLLNILQKPDGSLDDETEYILKELAGWNVVCSEGVYGTRPWRVSGEGSVNLSTESYKEAEVTWTDSDYRFTCKGNIVYAFMMKTPAPSQENHVAVIRSFSQPEKVLSVKLLGEGAVPFTQNYGVLTVKLPGKMPTQYCNCLAVELN